MTAYYNEFDPYAAQWLRNLIAAGHIAPGDVDERSIMDVHPDDLKGYTQCHFFAGIGGWSLAARLAGWPDDRELWTGSCPCQPFSVAGKGEGQADERHLWPVFAELIRARRPAVVMGEQVAAAVGKHWLDGVCADLEGFGYAVGAAVVPACAVDAPHRRDRLWFVADAGCSGDERGCRSGEAYGSLGAHEGQAQQWQRGWPDYRNGGSGARGIFMADPNGIGSGQEHQDAVSSGLEGQRGHGDPREEPGRQHSQPSGSVAEAGRVRRNSTVWSGAEWLAGADGKARRFEPGIRLLAHGVPARVGKLRAYGNAIVPVLAAEIIGAYLEYEPDGVLLEGDAVDLTLEDLLG